MKWRLAREAGFCHGVRQAFDSALEAAASADRPLVLFGELVHNPLAIAELESAGYRIADRVADIEEPSTVVIRAHGLAPVTRNELLAGGHQLIDCTCPFVAKVQRMAAAAGQAGKGLIVTGQPDHAEVIGVVGHYGAEAVVISSVEEAQNRVFAERDWVLVSQTTFSEKTFQAIAKVLQAKIAKLEMSVTICGTTASRQAETAELARESNLMLILGSRNSSNTMKLYEVARSHCPETHLVERAEEVRLILSGRDHSGLTIGLAAGASTPERMIGEVIQFMTEQEGLKNQQESADLDFSEFVDSIPQLRKGSIVKGTIIRFDDEYVYVDVKDKSEGRIPKEEFANASGFDLDDAVNEHREIDVYVRNIRNTDHGKEISLSKTRVDYAKDREFIEKAYEAKEPVQVRIRNVVKDGLIATYGNMEIYIHRTQIEPFIVKELEPYVGQEIEIQISQFDTERRRLRVTGSRRALLQRERRRKANEIWAAMEIGNEYEGTVRNLTDFGAFVDLGGVDGLVHISELSWGRIKHPSEVVTVGDKIPVFVKDFDPERRRVSLGYRRPEMDPYRDIEERFPVGSIVRGIVVRIFPFGAFVEIAPGVDALCHISQISDYRLQKPNDVLAVGMEVDARVIEVSNQSRRVSISIRDVEPINPERPEPMPQRESRRSREGREDELPTSYSDRQPMSSLSDVATITRVSSEVSDVIEKAFDDKTEEVAEEVAVEAAVVTEPAVDDAVAAVEESVEQVEETAAEAVAEAVEEVSVEAAETVEEGQEVVAETVESLTEEAGEGSVEAAEAVVEAVAEGQEAVSEAVESLAEAVTETAETLETGGEA